MFILNGNPVQIDAPFTAGDINYPPGWLRFATPDARAALGITEVPDPVRPDDRFYNVSPTLNDHFQYDATPKDLEPLKEDWIAKTKADAFSRLTPTDWLVIREVEEPGSMPAEKKAYRKAVRTRSSEIEVAINACVDVPMLEAFVTGDMGWPEEAKAPEKKTTRGVKG
jgi:hypothetical protein